MGGRRENTSRGERASAGMAAARAALGRGLGACGAAVTAWALAGSGGSRADAAPGGQPQTDCYRLEVEVRRLEQSGAGGFCTRDRTIFGLAELERLPQSSVAATIRCSKKLEGLEAAGPPPPPVRWAGPSLQTVLRNSGVEVPGEGPVTGSGAESEAHVELFGADVGFGQRNGRPKPPTPVRLPLRQVWQEDVVLALTMDGQPLPPEKGAPVRAVVPGRANHSVKWLRKVVVTTESAKS